MARGTSRRERVRDTIQYYRTVAPHIDRELEGRPDRRFWSRVGDDHPDARVLEIGCGTGRVTALLAPRVDRVAAVDLSPDMLRRARRRFSDRTPVSLVRADALALPLAPAFELAVAANGVFSHLLEDRERLRALRQIRGRLRPGGRLLVDAFWLSRERRAECAPPSGDRRRRSLGDDGPDVEEAWLCDPDGRRCRVRFRYRHPEGEVEEAETVLRPWTKDEVRRLLPEAGLRITGIWGDYERAGWTAESPRLVVRARRPV